VIYKTISILFYAATKILNNITNIKRKTICFLLLPIILIFPMFLDNEVMRRAISGKIIPLITLFNVFYITIIALLSLLKDNNKLSNIQKKERAYK
jgi:hypothetical protein